MKTRKRIRGPWIIEGRRTDGSRFGVCHSGVGGLPWSMNNDPDEPRVHRFNRLYEAESVRERLMAFFEFPPDMMWVSDVGSRNGAPSEH